MAKREPFVFGEFAGSILKHRSNQTALEPYSFLDDSLTLRCGVEMGKVE